MTLTDVIAVLIVAAALGGAIAYIIRAKKRGARCIGCPSAGCCSKAHRKDEGSGGSEDCGCGCCGGNNN